MNTNQYFRHAKHFAMAGLTLTVCGTVLALHQAQIHADTTADSQPQATTTADTLTSATAATPSATNATPAAVTTQSATAATTNTDHGN